MNHELPDVQVGFRKDRGPRDQTANIWWIMEKAREFQKNIYFCFIDYAKAFDCMDHNKLWKILQEMGWIRKIIKGQSPSQWAPEILNAQLSSLASTDVNFLMFKLVLEKAEEPEIKLPTSSGS